MVKQTAVVYDRFRITQELRGNDFTGPDDAQLTTGKVDFDLITGPQFAAQAVVDLHGVEFTGRDTVAKENPGIGFGNDRTNAGSTQCNRCMFTT